jgi:predicted O-linked N-acetylglucosamine transferase (SPINDLY family)
MGHFHAALRDFQRAIEIKPHCDYLLGMLLHMKRYLCDWDGIDDLCREMEARIARGERVCIPFSTLSISGSLVTQQQAGQILVRDKYPNFLSADSIPRHPPRDKIRIGYYSADFRVHAICFLMAEVFEHHDSDKFEIFGFSFGPRVYDQMTARVAAAFNSSGGEAHFFDVRDLTEQQVTDLSRSLEIDIAIDLTGFTEHYREAIFSQRAAPIQVSYLGYPGSMGAGFIDYILGDEIVAPASAREHYTEKIIALPGCFQAYDTSTVASDRAFTRADENLPDSDAAFVFCCFNNAYKISPETFAVWMRLLAQVPGSVLWLLASEPATAANLRAEAAGHGVDPARLIFAPRLPLADHLARQRLADLFLDTLPFNAGATCSPALWAGLPVLTCMGATFAGRMAASLLHAVGLPELVTENYADYERVAVALAHDRPRYNELRARLERNRRTSPVFNTAAFTRTLEAAYTAIHTRHTQGLPPDHIAVE